MKLRTRGRFNLKHRIRGLVDRIAGSPFDRTLDAGARARLERVVFYWNRGLGDVALGLVPMFAQVFRRLPGAAIEVVTRADLADAFRLTQASRIHVVPGLARSEVVGATAACARLPSDPRVGALVFDEPDPARWLATTRHPSSPRLRWDASYESLAAPFIDPRDSRPWIAVHANTETSQHYGYVKDWPAECWRALFAAAGHARDVRFVLLGHQGDPPLAAPNVIDLRGRTGLIEMLALVRVRCAALIAPDGGILNTVYFLDADFPITVVSLWSDPRQGLLKSRAASPNPRLEHHPLVGAGEDVRAISPQQVLRALAKVLA